MVKRIDSLTDEQRAQMDAHADKWIDIGLRTGPADRPAFEAAAQACYAAAGIKWPGRVVWVTSPLVMAIAAPTAALVIELARRRSAVDGAVASAIWRGWANHIGGQFWAGGWWWGGAYTSFFREVCSLELPGALWAHSIAYENTIKSACWWYPHRDFVMVCERPTVIHRELVNPWRQRGLNSHRLHCETGPAVAWPDGWGVFAIHGVRVPADVVEHPESITIGRIRGESNAEVRRVMIERYGYERYIADAGLTLVDSCPADHRLVGLRTARLFQDGELVLLDVLNSTPEPDGSVKRYVLPIDPEAYGGRSSRDCLAAMASTWRKRSDVTQLYFAHPEDYAPMVES